MRSNRNLAKGCLLFLFVACAPQSQWHLEALSAGEAQFHSSKLTYITKDPFSGANIELIYRNGNTMGYLTSLTCRFGKEDRVKAKLKLATEILEEELFLHEGRMRTKLPDRWTEKLIQALQEEKTVAILIGSIEETVQPEEFSSLYEKLLKGDFPFLETLRGPLR